MFRTVLFPNVIRSFQESVNIEAVAQTREANSYDKIKEAIEIVFNLSQRRPSLTMLGFYQGSTIAGVAASENSIGG